jgi:hypothetical protein
MKKRILMMFLYFTIILSLVISGANAAESGSAYKGASSWAVPELDKASRYGLVTERIKDNMSANITREEFAEIAIPVQRVFTYQVTAGIIFSLNHSPCNTRKFSS